MRILFDSSTGTIHHAVLDRDWFSFQHSTNIPLTTFVIDEVVPANQAVCLDLWRRVYEADVDGLGKYHMQQVGGEWELHERDGWEQAPEVQPWQELP